jgi:diguanylate cyclase (GGDEF)-like protein/PAS domain S-box-containing protein
MTFQPDLTPSPANSPSRLGRARRALARLVRGARTISPAQVRTNAAILRAQQEATLEGILVVDMDGNVLSYNRRFLEIWRIPASVAEKADDNELLGFAAELVADWPAFIEVVNYLYEHPEETRSRDEVLLRDGRLLERASLPVLIDGEVRARSWHFRDATEAYRATKLHSALFRITQLSRQAESLEEFYKAVHATINELMDARNFYIAEHDRHTNRLTFPYFVDEHDWQIGPMDAGHGLTAYVLRTGQPLLVRPEDFDGLVAAGEVESIGFPSVDWMGAPLVTAGETWGVIGTQTYTEESRFTSQDLDVLVFVAQHVASAAEHQRRAEALRQSEQRYRQMFENNRAVKLLIDPVSGALVDVNMAACDFYGYTREQLLSMHVFDINVAGREDIEQNLGRATNGERQYFQFRHRLASGALRDVEVHSGPIEVGPRQLLFSIVHDITERKRAEEMLRKQSAAITASMDGIGILDARLEFTYVNDSLARLFGHAGYQALVGRSLCDLYEPQEQVRFITNIVPLVQERGRWRGEATGLRRDGTTFPQEISLSSIGAGGFVCIVRDITERTYAEEQIKHLAYHDALTNLPNRLLFKDRLTVALSHAQRDGSRLAVLFLDLDRFKVINDSLGHTIGDHLLQAVASRIQACVRDSDTVARLGGDEFIVLLPRLLHADDALPVAEKIIEAIRYPFHIDARELFVTTSIGISLFPEDGTDAEALIKNADTAMYQAKEVGRDNYQLFNAKVSANALQRIALEHGLRRALANEEFEVHYQPIFDVRENKVTGMEALLRWNHPQMGSIPPSLFIPVAETTGVMIPIGSWALREACRQAREWHDAGHRDLSLAVNLSVTQLQQVDLVQRVAATLEETGLPPHMLELEITESSAMQSPETSIKALYDLKKLGIRISLDDFGTGHSSLSYLKRFPIDTLKIDQSFVRDIATDRDTAAIVMAIIAMAHSLRLKVIAEGVEQNEQAQFLGRHECDQMQGFLLKRPIPAREFLQFIRERVATG